MKGFIKVKFVPLLVVIVTFCFASLKVNLILRVLPPLPLIQHFRWIVAASAVFGIRASMAKHEAKLKPKLANREKQAKCMPFIFAFIQVY